MTATVVTPFARSRAIELGNRLWRKRILPVGTITYRGPGAPPEGRKISFTQQYLAGLAEAFRSRAYDQVPFQLATDANKHTNDPERFRGEILDIEAAPDGLYATCKVTPAGEKILSENPALGVSARINEQYQRSDGAFFPAAIQHVLGTLDPHVPQLGPWQQVDLANAGTSRVIDLSGYQFDGPAGGGLSDEQMAVALERVGTLESAGLLGDDDDEWTDDELAWLAGILAEADAIGAGQEYQPAPPDDELAAVGLSSAAYRATAHRVADAAIRAGDFETAAAVHIDLADLAASGSIEMANRDSYGRFGRICGHDDGFGRCGSPFHQAGCGAVVEGAAASGDAESALAWNDAISHRADAMVVSGSVTYEGTDGQPWTIRDQVFASMGLAPRQTPFETGTGKPEAPEPRRTLAMGDPDDPAAGKHLLMSDRDLAARLGLSSSSADDARRIGADRLARQAFGRGSAVGNLQGSPLEGSRTWAGPSAGLAAHGDGILGSQVALTNARDAWEGPYG